MIWIKKKRILALKNKCKSTPIFFQAELIEFLLINNLILNIFYKINSLGSLYWFF